MLSLHRRLITYSFETENVVNELKLDEKLNAVRLSPQHPDLLLIGMQAKKDQLRVFDKRTMGNVLTLNYTNVSSSFFISLFIVSPLLFFFFFLFFLLIPLCIPSNCSSNIQKNEDHSPSQFITPSWSADGLFIASGSVDPVVHIWDVRYQKVEQPTQTFNMHSTSYPFSFYPSPSQCLSQI